MEAEVTAVDNAPVSVPETVPLEEAADSDLDAYLQQLIAEEGEAVADPGDEQPLEESESISEQEKPEQAPEPETVKQAPPPLETQEDQQAKWQQVQQQLQQQGQTIQQQVALLANQKAAKLAEIQQLKEGLDEQYTLSPSEAFARNQYIQRLEQEVQGMDAYRTDIERVHNSQMTLVKHLTPDEADLEAMAQVLASDGIPAAEIQKFQARPYDVPVSTLIQLGKRGGERKLLLRLADAYKAQQAELAELRKSPGKVLNGIQKALNAPPKLNGGSGGSKGQSQSTIDPTKLSEEELERALASAK